MLDKQAPTNKYDVEVARIRRTTMIVVTCISSVLAVVSTVAIRLMGG
jgi:hypothetical protein